MTNLDLSLDFATLQELYRSRQLRPTELVDLIYDRIDAAPKEIWIQLQPRATARQAARELEEAGPTTLPLFGIPFAVKDNLDVAHVPTTAACPEFAYTPERHATVVARLLAAGALFIGKTNLDQFATGLVGVRSPYGACRNPFHSDYLAGGSSSGSAVAVATGLVSFSLGTDTAGSGRVPAGFNNLVGIKPTRGLLSSSGMVPACRSLDCVSIFALTVDDAQTALELSAAFDESDAYSRIQPESLVHSASTTKFRFGIPDQLEFFGDHEAEGLFQQACQRLEKLGGQPVQIDFTPFLKTAELLYGPWVAERWQALQAFHTRHADAFHPITRQIIENGRAVSASDLFETLHRLEEMKGHAAHEWGKMDVLFVPTAPSIYTLAEVAAEPIKLNSQLGYYTNFVNLLDGAAIAVPSGFRADGLPSGVTFIGPAWSDRFLAELGRRYHQAIGGLLGATKTPLRPVSTSFSTPMPPSKTILISVVGAHLAGEPLNHQLTDRGGQFVRKCRTKNCYRLYALETTPPKPGLVLDAAGRSIEVEVWSLPEAEFGSFMALVAAPLCIGTVLLEDGEAVKGFLCEPYALASAQEITEFGGWRAYRAALQF